MVALALTRSPLDSSSMVGRGCAVARTVAAGALEPEEISEEHLCHHMSLKDLPEPDLFIRTGGEQRISNFLLWDMAYTELYFTETLWPDFNRAAFDEALASYARRQRRFGRTSEQVAAARGKSADATTGPGEPGGATLHRVR